MLHPVLQVGFRGSVFPTTELMQPIKIGCICLPDLAAHVLSVSELSNRFLSWH